MRSYIRYTAAVIALALPLGSCGDDSDMSDDAVVGSWTLESIGGSGLPAPIAFTGGLVFTVNSASADVTGMGTFEATYEGEVAGLAGTAVIEGTWSRVGGTYTVTGTAEVNGNPLGAVTETGTVTGTTLTLGDQVWQKD